MILISNSLPLYAHPIFIRVDNWQFVWRKSFLKNCKLLIKKLGVQIGVGYYNRVISNNIVIEIAFIRICRAGCLFVCLPVARKHIKAQSLLVHIFIYLTSVVATCKSPVIGDLCITIWRVVGANLFSMNSYVETATQTSIPAASIKEWRLFYIKIYYQKNCLNG